MSNIAITRIPRVGLGWDSHEFKSGLPLKIGGVSLVHHSGLAGHSDGDVLLHALTDALLGAIAAGAQVKVSASKTGLTIDGQEFAASPDQLIDAAPAGVSLN